MSFSEEEKRDCCLMISIGCDRQTACHYLGKTAQQLRQQLEDDGDFHTRILKAEANPEFKHMRNLHEAAKEQKNWRVSVWWLEHCAPERFGRRSPDSLTVTQLRKFVDELAESMLCEVHDPEDRTRLQSKLAELTTQLQDNSFQSNHDLCHIEPSDEP